MRRATTTLALALFLLGCGSEALPADRVALMIANKAPSGCYLTYHEVDLIADPLYGTAVQSIGASAPVYWPAAYTGHRVGSEVEVRNPSGKVVATTGRSYHYWKAELYEPGVETAYIGTCLSGPIEGGGPQDSTP